MPSSRNIVAAIPLNRTPVRDFLLAPAAVRRGATVSVIRQQPSPAAQSSWMTELVARPAPSLNDLLSLDEPRFWRQRLTTDRLVPARFLRQQGFLTRNLGGWMPIYFGVMALEASGAADPLLAHAETLIDYGPDIRTFGGQEPLVRARVEHELDIAAESLWPAVRATFATRPIRFPGVDAMMSHASWLYERIRVGDLPASDCRSLPLPLLLDELRCWLVEIELQRRRADAGGDMASVDRIENWQASLAAETGLTLIVKGEYIVGRHRRSTVLIAPELGRVLKQPGPEPFHEIVMGARWHERAPENWPRLTQDGSLVTPRGRVRLTVEEGVIPRLLDALGHPMTFHTFLGVTVEPYVDGPTSQEIVLRDAAALNESLYETYVLHQFVAELLGVENGDWHSANFVRRDADGALVHVDWGAARPLRQEEMTPSARLGRLDQVKNIAFSFHDEALAAKAARLHDTLVADETRLERLWKRAADLIAGT